MGHAPLSLALLLSQLMHAQVALHKDERLLDAAESGDAALCRKLLRSGADPDVRAEDGTTPLILAARKERLEVVKELLKAGADPNAMDMRGDTAVTEAVDNVPVVRVLLDAGADVNQRNPKGQSPLFFAGSGSIELLVSRGARVDARDQAGITPLIHAAQEQWREEVSGLIRSGADVNAAASDGQTALHHAMRGLRKREVVQTLLRNTRKTECCA